MLSTSTFNYFNLHVCPSLRRQRMSCPVLNSIPAVVSQNVTNESYLVCVKSEKYAFLVKLRPLGFMRQGEAKLRTYIKTYFSVSSHPQCQSQAILCDSITRMYPRSGYFLVKYRIHWTCFDVNKGARTAMHTVSSYLRRISHLIWNAGVAKVILKIQSSFTKEMCH